MSRVLVVVALAVIGCGRLDFGRSAADAGQDALDAPPVPSAICGVHRLPMAAIPIPADLAVAPVTEGYLALWVDMGIAAPAHGAMIDPTHQLLRTLALPAVTETGLGGMAETGQAILLASTNDVLDVEEHVWLIDRVTGGATLQSGFLGNVAGHDPFPTDVDPGHRVFVTAHTDQLKVSAIGGDGAIDFGAPVQLTESSPIIDLACTSGPDHAHCAWIESAVNLCYVAEITTTGAAPVIGAPQILSINCNQIRTASGPAGASTSLTVWQDAPGGIIGDYVTPTGGVGVAIADKGAAPKLRFDGTRFWVAWLDTTSTLRLTSVAIDGTTASYALPGWRPVGPEAFELVTGDNETALVLLSPDSLDFLTICA